MTDPLENGDSQPRTGRVAKMATVDQEKAVAEARVEEKEVAKQQLEDLRLVKEKEREDAISKLKVGINISIAHLLLYCVLL